MNTMYRFSCLFIILSLLFLLSGCQDQKEPLLTGTYDVYTASVLAENREYTLNDQNHNSFMNPFYYVRGKNMVECTDVQVMQAVDSRILSSFLPQCLTTIVIAVDQDQTSFSPESWNDLLISDVKVAFPNSRCLQHFALGALAYGLEGENYTCQSALDYLKTLKLQNRLSFSDELSPVMICQDMQASRWIGEGHNLKIIIPKEGTFSFALGLLSNEPVQGASERMLLKNGLRLVDGRTDNPAYPSTEKYAPAVRVKDIGHYTVQTQNTTRNLRRQVENIRLYSAADGRETILFLNGVMIITVIWAACALHRITHKVIRNLILLTTFMILGWLSVSLLKYQLPSNLLSRLLWYVYYIFLIGLPLILLYTSVIVDHPDQYRKVPSWFLPFLILYPVLVLLVLTNDFHHLVFGFDIHGNWSDVYTYNIVYYLIFLYCIVTFLCSVFLLIQKSRKSPKKKAWLFPSLVALLLILYNTGYVLGISFCRESNLAMIFCCFSILFLESLLSCGLVPGNSHYRELFSCSILKLQLLDNSGKTVLASSFADTLDPVERFTITSDPGCSISKDENTLLHSRKIHGGIAVWQEDITQINELHQKITTSVEQLKAANALLQKEEEIRHRKIASDIKTRLFDLLEKDIEEKTDELSECIRQLPQASDKDRQISYITLLLCHIKRRCNLFFVAQEGNTVSSTELAVYLDELSEFAGYAQLHSLVRCGINTLLDVKTATLCYDFYFTLLSWAVRISRATLVAQLEIRDGQLVFSVLCSEPAETLTFSDSFLHALHLAQAAVSFRNLEDTCGIYLVFSKKEGEVL